MAWQDRLKPASYTPKGGTPISFDYADVSVGAELRGSTYDFAGREGTYVQPTGSSGRTMPLRLLFSGADYDVEADSMFAALRVAGVGVLDHPVYGRINVVPLGSLNRRDDLVSGANQAVIEVVFWETIGALYPDGQSDPASAVSSAVATYNDAAAQDFANGLDLSTEVQRVSAVAQVRALTDAAEEALSPLVASTDAVRTQFDEIYNSINLGIDTVIGQPLDLAFQISLLLQSPGRAAELWGDKLDAYGNLADQIFATTPQDTNQFKTSDIYAAGALTGLIVSAVNTTFSTQPDALRAAQNVLSLSDSLTVWRDTVAPDDTGASYREWQQAAALCAGFLVEISFTLAQERTITLARNRSIIDVCAQLYGSIDDQLDFFINSNALSGSEIIELPAGRVIKYYV